MTSANACPSPRPQLYTTNDRKLDDDEADAVALIEELERLRSIPTGLGDSPNTTKD